MPKHIHADLINEYAKLAQKTDRPWEHFEVLATAVDGSKYWEKCRVPIGFYSNIKYRLKPRTIKIGEYDVPEPVREALENGTEYYYPDISYGEFVCDDRTWSGDVWDKYRLSSGLIHLDRESAELHAKALIALTSK
ncbi:MULTISPECIES: hypothetical protein [Xenorhabdus]|uniref:hypothetical protein n=1 Tax=Xenorhabdus TaxID=626 RepID=UPI0006497687|nr:MULTISPECIES: hypothetical protein [Xenorhabdus]KLU15024.1 hypothetical protein AAY47_13190 [Xenorhabdus griffiniae]KOP35166.1 hypothetical protein AFK69_00640 [Xenorhabdus sp. GDc328]